MKTALLFLFTVLILLACSREQVQDRLSPEQISAVQKMEASYQEAKAYNDSLIVAMNGNRGTALIAYYDSRYHQHETAFATTHSNYQHTSNAANHTHNSSGMVDMHSTGSSMMSSGRMMSEGACGCCSNGGHSATVHEGMEALHRLHAQHHP